MSENLFKNLKKEEIEKILICSGAYRKNYSKGEIVCRMTDKLNKIGIFEKGCAKITCIDLEGQVTVVENIEQGGLFGEVFTLPIAQFEYYVEAKSDSSVLFVDYEKIINFCDKSCDCHKKILNNFFEISALKSRNLLLHINVLTRKSTKEKLLCYFETLCRINKTNTIKIETSYIALSEYINSNRSAMMRELKSLCEAGVISIKGKTITLLDLSEF